MNELPHKIITLLFIQGDPVSVKNVAEILETTEQEIADSLAQVTESLTTSGLALLQQNNQLVITTKSEYSDIAQRVREYELSADLTPAQLQTLTIVAYMGPVNNANVSFIRGVQSSQTLRSLNTRGLVTKADTQFIISIESMKYLGITKVEDLPMYTETREKLNAKIAEALNG